MSFSAKLLIYAILSAFVVASAKAAPRHIVGVFCTEPTQLEMCAHRHEPNAKWQGTDGRVYCGEFCEDGGPERRH